MSVFADLVVKFERQKLGQRNEVLPAVTHLQYINAAKPDLNAARIKCFLAFIILAVMVNVDSRISEVQSIIIRDAPGWVRVLVTLVCAYLVLLAYWAMRSNKAEAVAEDIISDREKEAAERQAAAQAYAKQRADELRLSTLAQDRIKLEMARDQAARRDEAARREQALVTVRDGLLTHMESSLKQVLLDYRKRAYWVPETADEEALYEKIRLRIRQADVPEFGILRRSSDVVVTMILGDRSCLPVEPSLEVLQRRSLPPVGKLLGMGT